MWIALKLFSYILFGGSIIFIVYGLYGLVISSDKQGNLRWNMKTALSLCSFLMMFLAGALLSFANNMHQKQQALKVSIVQKCGQVMGYYPKTDKQILVRETVGSGRTGSHEIRYAMTLKIDGKKDYFLPLPDNFQKIPIEKWACFDIQDGSKKQGAYQNQILRTVSVIDNK